MPKFILIDPSIQDYQGHYYEYALRVVKAARAEGFEPVIGANRSCEIAVDCPAEVRPVYRYAFWFNSTKKNRWLSGKRLMESLGRTLDTLRLRMAYSHPARLWRLRRELGPYVAQQPLASRSGAWLPLLLMTALVFRIAGRTLNLIRHAIPFQGYVGRLARDVLGLVALLGRPLRNALFRRGPVSLWFWQRIKMLSFARDTQRLFRQKPLQQGDVVLLSLASMVEVVGLANYFRRDPSSARASWHMMFRHQLYSADAGSASSEDNRPLRNAFYYFRDSLDGHEVQFHADTEELAGQYNELGIMPFTALPIPISDEYRRGPGSADPTGPLCVTYAGDARREKGYPLLPKTVQDLWRRHVATGHIRFEIQSNFSVPGGAPDTRVACAQLQAMPPDRVTLLTEPLDSAEYRELVTRSDLILLPYHRIAYYAGSSGILAEALAAGVPVVVPAGTWMALQLAEPIHRYHREVARRVETLRMRRLTELDWMVEGVDGASPMKDGRLQLGGQPRRFCSLCPPEKSTHVMIQYRQHTRRRAQFTELSVIQKSVPQACPREDTLVLGGAGVPASAIVPVDPETRSVVVGLRGAFRDIPVEISDLRIDFLRAGEPLPTSAVGVVLSRPEDLSAAAEEIIAHHEHYRRTAMAHAESWAEYHNPRSFLRRLSPACPKPPAPPAAAVPPCHFHRSGKELPVSSNT